MKKLRNFSFKFAFLFIAIFILSGCSTINSGQKNAVPKIVALNFPAYDFARAVCGESADISMLIPPGGEVHTYDPTVKDRIEIENCDIFIYTGGEGDAWADQMLASSDNNDIKTIKMIDAAELLCEHEHEHGEEHDHEHEEFDEHVWTSPTNAIAIVRQITDTVCKSDPENAALYRKNAEEYIAKIEEIRTKAAAITEDAERNTIVFADRFAMRYFTEEFGLNCRAAFPGCSEQVQASAKTVAEIIKFVDENDIPVVLYAEISDQKLADSICEATGAKKALLHSAHSVTKDEFDSGITYTDIMENNLKTLQEAL